MYPRSHGIVGDSLRLRGRVARAWSGGPSELRAPTLADLYDRSRSNRPLVGLVGADTAGLGLIGHGASFAGGERDAVAIHSRSRPDRWGVPTGRWSRDYRTVSSLSSLSGLSQAAGRLDALDGARDGRWEGTSIASLAGGFDTPAGADYETKAVERLVRDRRFGADPVPDLLFVSYGMVQTAEERWGLGSVQVGDTIQALDRQLLTLRSFLNREVGKDRWVLILTADHGARGNPKYTGAYAIDPGNLRADLQRRFSGGPGNPTVVQAVGPTQLWMNVKRLSARGYTLYDVSRFLLDYTVADNSSKHAEGGSQPVFQAAFPSALFPVLPCLGS